MKDRCYILVSFETCFVFDTLGKTWQERNQFKANATLFVLTLQNERVLIFDGPLLKDDARDDSKYKNSDVTKFKIYCQLPKPLVAFASAKLSFVK